MGCSTSRSPCENGTSVIVPPPPLEWNDAFRNKCIAVDIDDFHHLNYDQSFFVYRGLIRTAHRRYLHEECHEKHKSNVYFRTSFSFKTFTPPWFPGKWVCRHKSKPLLHSPLVMEDTCLPRKAKLRRRGQHTVRKLKSVIAAFYKREASFGRDVIDYLMAHCSEDRHRKTIQQTDVDAAVTDTAAGALGSAGV